MESPTHSTWGLKPAVSSNIALSMLDRIVQRFPDADDRCCQSDNTHNYIEQFGQLPWLGQRNDNQKRGSSFASDGKLSFEAQGQPPWIDPLRVARREHGPIRHYERMVAIHS